MAKQTKKPQDQAPAQEEQKVSTAVAPMDWSMTGVTGFEGVSKDDLGIPFLAILQSNSPQVNRADKNYPTKKIDGAGAGDIFNTLTNQIIHEHGGEPFEFIPCFYDRAYVEWKPRDQGGGFVRSHKDASILNECQRDDKNKDVLRNGNIIVNTAYFFGNYVDADGTLQRAVVSMTSTQLKKARAWLNMAQALKLSGPNGKYTPPLFSHKYLLSTVPESNQDGSWFGWKVELGEQLGDQKMIADVLETAKVAASGQRKLIAAPGDDSTEAF